MPFWLSHREDRPVAPYTLAHALGSGWMWQIPTLAKIGCGYVYADTFTTPEKAKAEIETVLGHEVEPRADIRINSWRRDRAWIGNSVAIGLSQSFFEPLEATSIHGSVVQLGIFCRFHLPLLLEGTDPQVDRYNEVVARQVNDFCDFINIHYVSERDDTPFWQHVRQDCIGKRTKQRLEMWRQELPKRSDFKPFPGDLPHIEEQLYYPVLDGLGLLDRRIAKRELAPHQPLRSAARRAFGKARAYARDSAVSAMDHRMFLTSLVQDQGR